MKLIIKSGTSLRKSIEISWSSRMTNDWDLKTCMDSWIWQEQVLNIKSSSCLYLLASITFAIQVYDEIPLEKLTPKNLISTNDNFTN